MDGDVVACNVFGVEDIRVVVATPTTAKEDLRLLAVRLLAERYFKSCNKKLSNNLKFEGVVQDDKIKYKINILQEP